MSRDTGTDSDSPGYWVETGISRVTGDRPGYPGTLGTDRDILGLWDKPLANSDISGYSEQTEISGSYRENTEISQVSCVFGNRAIPGSLGSDCDILDHWEHVYTVFLGSNVYITVWWVNLQWFWVHPHPPTLDV